MSAFARLAQIAEQARWSCQRQDMVEPGAIVARMIEDLEALGARDAPMTVDALIAMGWNVETAARFFPAAKESASLTRSLRDLIHPAFEAARLKAPDAANDDAEGDGRRGVAREARAFFTGAGFMLGSVLLIGLAVHLAWR